MPAACRLSARELAGERAVARDSMVKVTRSVPTETELAALKGKELRPNDFSTLAQVDVARW